MGFIECSMDDVKYLKSIGELQLSWNIPDGIYTYENGQERYALIQVLKDPLNSNIIWIDNFEVFVSKRNRGWGRKIISEFISEMKMDIQIMAKDCFVEKFWEKCGFVKEYDSLEEIPMIYRYN